jgi:predicted phage-related endonuclease
MLTEYQRAIRRTGITATDVRVLAGVDPYGRTPHDVWRAKVLGEEDFEETEAMELGHALEPIVVPRLAKKAGLHVLRVDPNEMTLRHPQRESHIATPDAFFAESAFHERHAIGQVKVCGLYSAGHWGSVEDGADAVPEPVLVQCAWELYVSRVVIEYVGALIGTQVRAYRIELTPDIAELIEGLVVVADQFWTDHVLTKQPPALDGSEGARRLLSSLYPRNRGAIIKASPEAEAIAREYFEAKRLRDEAGARLELATQGLTACVGDADGLTGDGWRLLLKTREETAVNYTRKAYRHFDMRTLQSKRGRAA